MSKFEILALKRPKPIRARTHRHNTLRLERPIYGDDHAIRAALEEKSARATVTRVLHHYLEKPELSYEVVCNWPNRLLLRVGRIWIREALCDDATCETLDALSERLRAYIAKQDRLERSMRLITGSFDFLLPGTAAIRLQESLANIMRPSPFQKILDSASASVFAPSGLIQTAFECRETLANVARGINTDCAILRGVTSSYADSLAASCSSIHDGLFGQVARISAIADELSRTVKSWVPFPTLRFPTFDTIFSGLDNFSRLEATLDKGGEALKDAGFGFLLYMGSIKGVVAVTRMHPKTREANITRRMLRLTGSANFEWEVQRLICSIPEVAGRWKPIRAALGAHRQRDYYLSIPALIGQVEGLLTELMYFQKTAIRYRGKPHMRCRDGKLRVFGGLDNKLDKFDHHDDPVLKALVDDFLCAFTRDRNSISHGNRIQYASPLLSAQLVWAVYILAFFHSLSNNLVTERDMIYLGRYH